MTCYVDRLRDYPGRRLVRACHLVCDTPEELDAIARAIGLDPRWKQDGGTWHEHVDLAPAYRRDAIRYGAVDAGDDWRRIVRVLAAKRDAG